MRDPIILSLLNYWEELRAGRLAPLRSEIDPRKFERALEHTFILERTAPSNLRFRLAGMKFCEAVGMEVRGMPAHAVIVTDNRLRFDSIVERVLDDPVIAELRLVTEDEHHNKTEATMLLMPMYSDFGEISRVLGCATLAMPMGLPPHRFRIAEVKITRIIASDDGRGGKLLPGFSEEAEAFAAQAGGAGLRPVEGSGEGSLSDRPRTRPNLRVVGGKDKS